jgi:hypothetical protein
MFFERLFTEPRCTGIWLALYSWRVETAAVAMVCVD